MPNLQHTPQQLIRQPAREWIENLSKGQVFSHDDLYQFLELTFPNECKGRGDAKHEPQFKDDARWAVQDAKEDGLLIPAGRRGIFQRV